MPKALNPKAQRREAHAGLSQGRAKTLKVFYSIFMETMRYGIAGPLHVKPIYGLRTRGEYPDPLGGPELWNKNHFVVSWMRDWSVPFLTAFMRPNALGRRFTVPTAEGPQTRKQHDQRNRPRREREFLRDGATDVGAAVGVA